MRWKSLIILMLSAALIISGCSSESTASTVMSTEAVNNESAKDLPKETDECRYLSMATSGNWVGLLRGNLFDEYCEKLTTWSDGKMKMKAYYNGNLGGDLELIEGVQQGTLCIINSVPSYQISAVPEAALLDIPGLFESVEEFNYFVDNYYMDTLQSYYEQAGLQLLSCSAYTYRVMTSTKPIRSMKDLDGLNLRTMENPYHVAFWQAMGATVVPMNFNEVQLSIQKGYLDAQENPLGYMISANLSDIQQYVTKSNHVLMVSNYLMNKEQYDALSEDEKRLLDRFMDEMSQELIDHQPEEDKNTTKVLVEKDIHIYDVTEDLKQGIQQCQQVVIDMLREDLGSDIVDHYLNQVAFAKEQYRLQYGSSDSE